eukprot:COSAG05_NODE_72_length_21963_cov_153.494535_15_plen_355_part_00
MARRTSRVLTMEQELALLREENRKLKLENQTLKSKSRLDRAAKHISGVAAPPPARPATVVEALHAAADNKSAVDADLATATAWVGAAFMKVGKRFASGGMRDRDVPRKPGHTNGNLGGGTITIAQIESCLAELSKDASGVLELYDPYQVYPWQKVGPTDIAYGIDGAAEFPALKGKIIDPDGGGTHTGPYGLFQQRMLNFGGGGDPDAPEGSRKNYFAGYGRQEIPHVHIPVPQPEVPPEPAVIQLKEGIPLQYSDFMGVGVRMVHPCNPRAPSRNLGYSYLFVPPHVVQEPGGHEVEEAYICLKGEGYIYLNGAKQLFTPSTWVWLPPWTEHGIDNTGNETMEILVMSGPPNA